MSFPSTRSALLVVFFTLTITRIRHNFRFINTVMFEQLMPVYRDEPVLPLSVDNQFPILRNLPRNESFGACLMVKGDNDLLSEWIPYHYTTLPLRYILVASDIGNIEDPNAVLNKWNASKTGLLSWAVNVSTFENLHGKFDEEIAIKDFYRKSRQLKPPPNGTKSTELQQYVFHSHLKHKQNAFITYCMQFMKGKGIQWITLYDTDEFLAMNKIHRSEKQNMTAAADESESYSTVMKVIESSRQTASPLSGCLTVPRIRFGADENFTCPGSEKQKMIAKTHFQFDMLYTLKYQKHAKLDDFRNNRFAKVIIQSSNISEKTVSKKPSNIHRPYKHICKKPVVAVKDSPFYLMHYAGGWERFKKKDDGRRGFEQWRETAMVGDSSICCSAEVYHWLPQFINQVGLDRAKYLLEL